MVSFFSDSVFTSGHHYKLFKRFSGVNASKYFCVNHLCDIWNSLPVTVVAEQSVTVFGRLLDTVDDFSSFCIT